MRRRLAGCSNRVFSNDSSHAGKRAFGLCTACSPPTMRFSPPGIRVRFPGRESLRSAAEEELDDAGLAEWVPGDSRRGRLVAGRSV